MAQLDSITIARSSPVSTHDSLAERDRVRAVLRLKRAGLPEVRGELHFRQLFAERGIDPFDAVLADDDRLPEQFRHRGSRRRSISSLTAGSGWIPEPLPQPELPQ